MDRADPPADAPSPAAPSPPTAAREPSADWRSRAVDLTSVWRRVAPPAEDERPPLERQRLVRGGVYAWSAVGLVFLFGYFVQLLGALQLVVVPLVIALFPASLLSPMSSWLKRRGWPPLAAASLVLVVFLVMFFGALTVLVWLIAGEMSDLVVTLEEAYDDVSAFLLERFGWGLPSIADLIDDIQVWATNVDLRGAAPGLVIGTVEVVSGILLGLIALFFYLKDGERITGVMLQVTPERFRGDLAEVFVRVWTSLGGYFRGQLMVAAVDAIFIGIGLILLDVPLAFPLAALVFFGGLFPIVGAFTAGGVAVLIALADGGVGLALAVLALNVGVQQLEGNLLEPLIVGRTTRLHPLLVLGSLSAGAVTMGLLGAFLAVPIAASVVRAVSYLLERDPGLDVDYDAELPMVDDYAEES
jgi:putative heme transporter